MAGSDTGEKTEAPTPKKLKDLRKKNTARRSQDLPAAASLAALALLVPWLTRSTFDGLLAAMKNAFTAAGSVDDKQAVEILGATTADAFTAVLAPVLVIGAVIAVTHAGYTRQKPNPAALKPQWKTLHPKEGVKRVISLNALVEMGKGVAKLLAVGLVAYGAWKAGVTALLTGPGSVEAAASLVGDSVRDTIIRVAGIALAIGAADAWWQNKRFNKQAKMSKYEVKKEHQQAEGDPMIKAQIRQRGQALTRNAMVAAAGDADVVVVNPTHIAVALKYSPDMPAPQVVAKGAGPIAQRIREVAAEHGVPVHQDVPLARALHKSVEVGQWIPVELYAAAAQLLAEVFKQRRKPGGTR